MAFNVIMSPRAKRDYRRLDDLIASYIDKALKQMQQNPFTHATIKLVSEEDSFRYRVGDYRILFEYFPKTQEIIVYRIAHRREAYR